MFSNDIKLMNFQLAALTVLRRLCFSCFWHQLSIKCNKNDFQDNGLESWIFNITNFFVFKSFERIISTFQTINIQMCFSESTLNDLCNKRYVFYFDKICVSLINSIGELIEKNQIIKWSLLCVIYIQMITVLNISSIMIRILSCIIVISHTIYLTTLRRRTSFFSFG